MMLKSSTVTFTLLAVTLAISPPATAADVQADYAQAIALLRASSDKEIKPPVAAEVDLGGAQVVGKFRAVEPQARGSNPVITLREDGSVAFDEADEPDLRWIAKGALVGVYEDEAPLVILVKTADGWAVTSGFESDGFLELEKFE